MFASLGHESLQRDELKRRTGRRHVPCNMTSETGSPTYYTREATVQGETETQYRDLQEKNATKGPSFMDRMFSAEKTQISTSSNGCTPIEGMRHVPQDQLNVFSWADRENVEPPRRGNHVLSDTQLRSIQGSTAEESRGKEARKFETNNHGNFLNFSEHEKQRAAELQRQQVQKPSAGRHSGSGTSAPYGSPQHGMLDSLNRGDGIHGQKLGKRPIDAFGPDASAPAVAGFPRMGQHAGRKQAGRRPAPAEPSKVFLPVVPKDGFDVAEDRGPSQRAHPQLQIPNDQVRPTLDGATGLVALSVHDSDGYETTPRHGKQPAWLQESSLQTGAGGMGPAECGSKYQEVAPQGRRHVSYEDQHREIQEANPRNRIMLQQYNNNS